MKSLLAALTLSVIFTAPSAWSKDLYCTQNSNADWILSVQVENGVAQTVSLSNQDWSGAGEGAVQSLSTVATLADHSEFVVVSEVSPTFGLNKGMEIHITTTALTGGSGDAVLVGKTNGKVVYTEEFRCF